MDLCPEQLVSVPDQFLERFGSRKREVGVILFDWATRLADMLHTAQGLQVLQDWGDTYDFPLICRRTPGFAERDNLDADIEWRDSWMSLMALCMGEKPDETATGAATQPPSSSQETFDDDNDDDDVVNVSY